VKQRGYAVLLVSHWAKLVNTTTVLELSVDGHIATATKDRTSLLDNQYLVPCIDTGRQLKTWLEGDGDDKDNGQGSDTQKIQTDKGDQQYAGEGEQKPILNFPDKSNKTRSELINDVVNLLRELGLADRIKQYERYLFWKYSAGLKDLDEEQLLHQADNLAKCQTDEDLKEKFVSFLSNVEAA